VHDAEWVFELGRVNLKKDTVSCHLAVLGSGGKPIRYQDQSGILVLKLVIAISLFVVATLFGFYASAEDVFVKYHGQVSLDQFSCSSPNSSFVHRICYRAEKQYLVVLLGSTYYHYCNLPPSIADQWISSDSAGKFYNYYVKGAFDCRLGGIPSD
jgi:hypothetical protein